jgi:hypothetical protein
VAADSSPAPVVLKPSAERSAETEASAVPSAVEDCATCGRVEVIRVAQVTSRDGSAEKRTAYRVTVRMEDGSFRTISQGSPPSVAVGERVKVANGGVVSALGTTKK